MYFVLFIVLLAAFLHVFRNIDKQRLTYSIIAGLILALFQTTGDIINHSIVYHETYFSIINICLAVLRFISYSAVLVLIIYMLFEYISNMEINPAIQDAGYEYMSFFSIWAIIIICWLPYYFIYYPGYTSHDSSEQIRQAIGLLHLDNLNSMAQTLVVRGCLFAGRAVFKNSSSRRGYLYGSSIYCIECSILIYSISYGKAEFSKGLCFFCTRLFCSESVSYYYIISCNVERWVPDGICGSFLF